MQTIRRQRKSSVEKRQRILDAAAKIFAERGYSETTLQHVGEECGIYAASIYYYFPSREDLVQQLLVHAMTMMNDELDAALAELPVDAPPLARLQTCIRTLVEANIRPDDYLKAYSRIFDQAPAPIVAPMRQERRKIRLLLDSLLKEAQDAGQIDPAADILLARFLIVGASHWVSHWFEEGGARSSQDVVEAYSQMFLKAIS